ncbi:MAG: aminopeptidase N, partial [Gammaproteobacteria bacterium]
MSAAVQPQTHYRKDFTAPDYFIRHIDLKVTIGATATRVDAQLQIERNPERPAGQALRLDGEAMELLALAIDGTALDAADYELVDGGLLIATVPERFRLDSTVMIDPDNNTALEGLYRSDNILCTQCEAEGFRHITYFMDRPDIMASYRTTIVADKKRYPVLLSNGNPVDRGEQGDQHWISWDDPYPKPCYLFALVAGDLACVEDHYTTASGRKVALQIYVDHGNEHRCGHALTSLKAAMAWDEQTYGLEYDLDVYMIVAVAAFNMGAMENKGLNLFNDRFILADPETATDDDYVHVRDVIGHEYFHNWTGNRVTLRDWFQLSLKESLTVFREQSFSAEQGMAAVNRISSVRQLRRVQFPEDAGPLAHPVRPESYIEMNNFYTATVYEKGAEVIRMMHTLLGDAVFRQAVRDYLQRFDGQAVTIEDFIATFEQVSGRDLQQFRLWYSQAGTPIIDVTEDYADGVYSLTFKQQLPATPGQHDKQPMLIPMRLGLLDSAGKPLPLKMETTAQVRYEDDFEAVVELREDTTSVRFSGIDSTELTASLLRGFSAPVRLNAPHTESQLHFLVRHDVDP